MAMAEEGMLPLVVAKRKQPRGPVGERRALRAGLGTALKLPFERLILQYISFFIIKACCWVCRPGGLACFS